MKTLEEAIKEIETIRDIYIEDRCVANSEVEETIEDFETVISAAKKQIPRKPVFGGLYACPNCHTIMLQCSFESREKCCKECGQAIDWSEN